MNRTNANPTRYTADDVPVHLYRHVEVAVSAFYRCPKCLVYPGHLVADDVVVDGLVETTYTCPHCGRQHRDSGPVVKEVRS